MEGIVWLFLALIVALIAVGLTGIRRRPPSIEQNLGRCSSHETPMSLRRVPLTKSHAPLGEWICPHCNTRMDKRGKSVSGTAS